MTSATGRPGLGARPTRTVDREAAVRDLLAGEYSRPVRIICFNLAEGWCRDVTTDLADEVRRRYPETRVMPKSVLAFLDANNRG
jgi:23S rRNA C2498 (ribose-2'-O)-methylase RlmM